MFDGFIYICKQKCDTYNFKHRSKHLTVGTCLLVHLGPSE